MSLMKMTTATSGNSWENQTSDAFAYLGTLWNKESHMESCPHGDSYQKRGEPDFVYLSINISRMFVWMLCTRKICQ
jgi:hypothetical protein